jgi:restriction endonuclease S subunit
LSDDELVYISEEKHQELIRSEVLPGDILLTKAGYILGYSAVFPEVLIKGNITSHLAAIRPSARILPDFLSGYLKSNLGNKQIYRWGNKSTRPELNTEEVRQILVPLPSSEVQRALVAEIEVSRQTRKQKLAQADKLLSSLDTYLLDQLGLSAPEESDRPVFAIRVDQIKSRLDSYSNQPRFRKLFQLLQSHQFPVTQLASISTDIFSGITPKSGGDAYTEELSGIPFIRSGEITKDGRVTESSAILIKPEIHEGLMRRSQLQQGDLLIAIVGATIGSVGVYDRSTPANINQAIAAVRLDRSRVLPDFARWFLSSPIGQAILDYLKRPVARANINLEEIGEIPILIPPLDIQRSVVEQVDNARLEMRRLRQEAETEWEAAKTHFERQLLGEAS